MYQNGDFDEGNAGTYTLEIRAWGDNDYDTGTFTELIIEVINPCLAQVVAPTTPLALQTYYVGSLLTQYNI